MIKEYRNRIVTIYSILLGSDTLSHKAICNYLAEVGQILAAAECILLKKREAILDKLLEDKPNMSANEQKVRIEARCAEEAKVVRMAEQLSKALISLNISNKNN